MDAIERSRYRDMADAMDASEDLPATQERHCHAGDLHLAFVAEKEIVKEHEQWWGLEMTARRDV